MLKKHRGEEQKYILDCDVKKVSEKCEENPPKISSFWLLVSEDFISVLLPLPYFFVPPSQEYC